MDEKNSQIIDEVEEIIDEKEQKTEEAINDTETIIEENTTDDSSSKVEDELDMLRKNKDEIKKLNNELEALKERLLRVTAEYENYRKRTTKEKEGIYTDACSDVLKEILPVVDNIERAYSAEGSVEDLKKGIEMTMKGVEDTFKKLGVEEIDATSEFDPNLHQAVMHIEDESLEQNQVVEVFMKGYKRGDKVIRHSVVKVAN
jgi:molecular chaperone GrpE